MGMQLPACSQLTIAVPPANREACCNQSSWQCAEKGQVKRWGLDMRAEEHPARAVLSFMEKSVCRGVCS